MPKNRQHLPRSERIAPIVAAARQLFIANGYDGTTMADVARQVGLAPAAVHWYFKSKDDLFAAALIDLVDSMKQSVDEQAPSNPREHLTLILETIEPYRAAHTSVLARIDESPALAKVYDYVYEWIDPVFLAAARPSFDEAADSEQILDLAHVVLDGNAAAYRRGRSFSSIVDFLLNSAVALEHDATSNPT